jgi:hypothetical protein
MGWGWLDTAGHTCAMVLRRRLHYWLDWCDSARKASNVDAAV